MRPAPKPATDPVNILLKDRLAVKVRHVSMQSARVADAAKTL